MPTEHDLKPIIPSQHLVIVEQNPFFVLCKPKLLPIKSFTLLKVETIQRDAEEKIRKYSGK